MKTRKKQTVILWVEISFFCLLYCLLASNALAQDCSKATVNTYIKKLNNTDEWIFTIAALRKCGAPAVSALAANLQQQDDNARIDAASALASMSTSAETAIPALSTALKDKNAIVRSSAATALGSMGAKAKIALPALTVALQDKERSVRSIAATAIGNMGIEAQATIPDLTSLLQDKDETVSSSAAYALGRIAADFQYQAKSLSSSDLQKIIWELETAYKAIATQNNYHTEVRLLEQSLKLLKSERDSRWLERIYNWSIQHKPIAILGLYVISLMSLWSLILWLRPLWLLQINNVLNKHLRIVPGLNKIKIPVDSLLFVSFFQHHPRVVEAWVNTQVTSASLGSENKARLLAQSKVGDNALEHGIVQNYAQAIAWECIKQTFQPAAVKRSQVLAAITPLDGRNSAQTYIQYLEKNLGMLETVGKAKDEIRFTHDFVAEHLASLYLVKRCGSNEVYWHQFLLRVDSIPNQQAIRGFLLAVRDSSLVLQTSAQIPSFVPKEIGKRVGIVSNLPGRVQIV